MKGEGQALIQIQNNFIQRPQMLKVMLNETNNYYERVSSIEANLNATENSSAVEVDSTARTTTSSAYQIKANIQQENRSLVISSCVRYF